MHDRVVASPVIEPGSPGWLDRLGDAVDTLGYAIVPRVCDPPLLRELRAAMYRVQETLLEEVGSARLQAAGELGVLRLMLKFDPVFFRLLELEPVLAVIDRTLSPTAIMHLQNGFILPPTTALETPDLFQKRFHMDFPRVLNGYRASINLFFAVDEFSEDNGATRVVPGSHQRQERPDPRALAAAAVPLLCPAGSMVVFDSTLWHAAGDNHSPHDRLAINHQFTHSYIKQQIDYVRALGDAVVTAQRPRTQQLLGWYTRVVTSLDEYYRPEAERLYRKGQG